MVMVRARVTTILGLRIGVRVMVRVVNILGLTLV